MTEEHLGGHCNKTHIDIGALNWAIHEFNVKSYLDVGCGPGGMVELAKQLGLKATGIDGDSSLTRTSPENYLLHDYTKGPSTFSETVDLCWSVEFVEHIYEEFFENYVQDFLKAKYLILTYAPPGWPGHHHVNCQPEKYWLDKLAEKGLVYSEKHTNTLREVSTMNKNWDKKAFVKNRGLVFINENL
jgi:SAM-dependent methyltransferase